MKIEALHIRQRVRHPQYGVGTVKSLAERAAEERVDDALRTIDPDLSAETPAEPNVSITGLEEPLRQFLRSTIEEVIDRMGYEKPEAVLDQLGVRWHKGRAVLHPADPTLQTKEVPLEVFFHKLVG